MPAIRSLLERFQIGVYCVAVFLGLLGADFIFSPQVLQKLITPTLALMLFVTFLQVPVLQLGLIFRQLRFLCTLGVVNFILVPLLVFVLQPLLSPDPIVRLAVLLVLLTPCIDYVITFAYVGRADASLLLAATPLLLLLQMLLLPIYLRAFLSEAAVELLHMRPFVEAFIALILIPLLLAALFQYSSRYFVRVRQVISGLDVLPVPATAAVLFVVVGAIAPQLEYFISEALRVAPIYVLYAVLAPTIGWWGAQWAQLSSTAARAVAFSAGTRNSLVILPLVLAIPTAQPLLPVLIITQTLVELLASLVYMLVMPRLRIKLRAASY